MSTHNLCFCGEIRKNIGTFCWKKCLIWNYDFLYCESCDALVSLNSGAGMKYFELSARLTTHMDLKRSLLPPVGLPALATVVHPASRQHDQCFTNTCKSNRLQYSVPYDFDLLKT